MSATVCKACGSTATRSENCGFNAWFAFFWTAAFICMWVGLYAAFTVFLVLALLKTFTAFFDWRTVCAACGSAEIIPADSPVGRKILAG